MTEAFPIPESPNEVESWLRASLPDSWVDLVDHGRSPGPVDLYEDFDKDVLENSQRHASRDAKCNN